MRLIDADKTIEHIKTRLHETALNNVTVNCDASYLYTECADNRIETWIDEMPTVDAEPIRHGHWRADETVYTTGEVWCSVCRTLYYIGDLYDIGGGNNLPNYCPHCGAKMD